MHSKGLANLIENLVHNIELDAASLKERYLLRQTLHAMVRLAKVEQVAAIRPDVRRVSSPEAGLRQPSAALPCQAVDQESEA